ncbi:C-C motif chemokine 28-like [Callorhinchus milii]|uniref:C-C motif chemokine 28 n=1 Tax=Callorhinchus milii TaxID=7868 RepID=V9LIX5_CALMI|nr:C-C motif chemokine 28-like [Callorhinchus milii]
MDTKIILLLLVTALAALHTTQGFPAFPPISCCTRVVNYFTKHLGKRVTKVEIQKTNHCTIKAVVLHTSKRKLCVDPNNKALKKWLKARKIPM